VTEGSAVVSGGMGSLLHPAAWLPAAGLTVDPLVLLNSGLLLLALGLLLLLTARLEVSAIPFFLLVGLALGEGGLLPVGVSTEIAGLGAGIGLLLLLLMLGLEFSAQELLDSVRRRRSAAVADIVLNAGPGFLVGWLLGWGVAGAVTLAGVTYISSSGIVSQLLREYRWRHNPETGPVVSLLVIEDLVMAPYLPLLAALVAGASLLGGLVSVTVALLVVGATFGLALRRWQPLRAVLNPANQASLLLTVFGLMLLVAGLAERTGFSAPVAAFLLGLLLVGEVADVARRRLAPLRDIFAALFFVFVGLETDPRELPAVLPVVVGLVVLGVLTKAATAWWAMRGCADERAWLRAGALLSARGEFSLVIAGLVATVPGAPPALAATCVGYVIVSALIGPLLVRLAARLAPPPPVAAAMPRSAP